MLPMTAWPSYSKARTEQREQRAELSALAAKQAGVESRLSAGLSELGELAAADGKDRAGRAATEVEVRLKQRAAAAAVQVAVAAAQAVQARSVAVLREELSALDRSVAKRLRDGQVGTAGPSSPGGTAAAYSCTVFGGQAQLEREAAELRQEQPEAAPSAAIRPATFGTAQLDTLRDQQLTPLHPLAGRSYS